MLDQFIFIPNKLHYQIKSNTLEHVPFFLLLFNKYYLKWKEVNSYSVLYFYYCIVLFVFNRRNINIFNFIMRKYNLYLNIIYRINI